MLLEGLFYFALGAAIGVLCNLFIKTDQEYHHDTDVRGD